MIVYKLKGCGFNIKVTLLAMGGGIIQSDLKDDTDEVDDAEYRAAVDGLESLILAQACAGVNVSAPEYVAAVHTAIDAVNNEFN